MRLSPVTKAVGMALVCGLMIQLGAGSAMATPLTLGQGQPPSNASNASHGSMHRQQTVDQASCDRLDAAVASSSSASASARAQAQQAIGHPCWLDFSAEVDGGAGPVSGAEAAQIPQARSYADEVPAPTSGTRPQAASVACGSSPEVYVDETLTFDNWPNVEVADLRWWGSMCYNGSTTWADWYNCRESAFISYGIVEKWCGVYNNHGSYADPGINAAMFVYPIFWFYIEYPWMRIQVYANGHYTYPWGGKS